MLAGRTVGFVIERVDRFPLSQWVEPDVIQVALGDRQDHDVRLQRCQQLMPQRSSVVHEHTPVGFAELAPCGIGGYGRADVGVERR